MPRPQRDCLELHRELHARPALPVSAPCVVSAWVDDGLDPAAAEAALAALCRAVGAAVPAAGVRHHLLQASGFALKFERHGEFVSWQAACPLADWPESPADERLAAALHAASALDALPAAFFEALAPGSRVPAAAHVVLLPAAAHESLLPRCRALLAPPAGHPGGADAASLVGAFVGDARRAVLLTRLHLGGDGFTRYALLDFGLAADQAAREVQRLCELEAYCMLALRGLPDAQREATALRELEAALQAAVDALAAGGGDDQHSFEALTRIAADIEHATARSRYRFSATHAYHRIVERRLGELREQRIEGVQTLSGFLARRFAPAMDFVASTDRRLTDLADRIHRAAALARVRVEQRREQVNQEVFKALAHRQQLQLRLQQTVEGLSVVAISYYALGLVGYLAKAAKGLPLPGDLTLQPDVVVGLAVVPVVATVMALARRLRRQLGH